MRDRILIASASLLLVLAATSPAGVQGETIDYRDGDVALQGYVAWDDAIQGRRPAVLVIHEWWGHNDYARRRARELAGLGYVAFALDMYGKGKSTTEAAVARKWSRPFYQDLALGQRRARAGLEVLRKHRLADPTRVAAIGYCFGGSMALNLAYSGVKIAGVVSFHGGLITPPEDAKIRCRILVCHGADDPMAPDDKVTAFMKSMRARGGVDWQFIAYGGAVHAFTNPAADKAGISGVAYHAAADRRSWRHMRMFFDELFAKS
jgi:dienelactone hydrolase